METYATVGRVRGWRVPAGLLGLLLLAAAGLTVAARRSDIRLGRSVGLIQSVHAGAGFSGPPVTRRFVRAIDLSILEEDPRLPRRFFSVRWVGTWHVPTSGPVSIYAGADDLVRVFIDDRLVIERNQRLGFHTIAAPVSLDAGPHQLVIEYAQFGGGLSLNVQWAPAGREPRPFPRESLFPSTPDATLVTEARLAARLGDLARAAWLAFGATLLSFVLLSLARAGRQWFASGAVRRGARRAREASARWQARFARPAFQLACIAVPVWIAIRRVGAFDPQTLWADDVWFACLTKLDSFWTAVTVPAPVAPGFVGLLWTVRRIVADPEVSLQLLPFGFAMVGPSLLGIVVSRLTSSYLLGIAAIALGFGGAPLTMYSVFVKPYSLDYVLTAMFLLLAVHLLRDGRDIRFAVAAAGLAAALFSVPSVFSSVALVHIAALAPGRTGHRSTSSKWRRWGTVAGFDLLLAALYFAVLGTRSNPELRAYWSGAFAPLSSIDALTDFLRTTGWTAIRESLPEPFAVLAPLAGIGLAALLVSRAWRWFGLFAVLVYAGTLAASMLQVYPIGTGGRVRTMIYSHALTTALVVVGFDVLTRWLPIRALVRLAAATLAVLGMARLAPPSYFALDHIEIVRALESRAELADAIVLNTSGAYLAGYYSGWSISVYPDESPQGFAVRIERPKTLTLRRTAEEGGPGLDVLDDFLARDRPARVFFLSTRRDTSAAEQVIRAHGFEEVRRNTSTVSTRLIEYHLPSTLGSVRE